MRSRHTREIRYLMRPAIMSLLLAGAIAAATAADGLIPSPEPGWPQWRGPRRDGISDEKGLLQTWPQGGPELLWTIDGLGKGWSCPIIVGDRIYITGDIGDDLMVFAFNTEGRRQWAVKNGASWKKSFPGARACCAFSDGRVYNLNAHGRLACLDAVSGKEFWAVSILDEFGGKNITWALSECLLVDGERVIVTPGGKKTLIAALDKRNGEVVWTTKPVGDEQPSYCSPILFEQNGRRVISNCSGTLGFAVDADSGELLWTVPLENRFATNVSTPVYDAGFIYYVTPYGEHGRQYRLTADGRGISAEHVWTNMLLDTVTGSGVVADGILFTSGYKKSKWWFGVDWKTGETKYESKDFTTGAAIYADNRLYCLDEKGDVGLLEAGTDGLRTLGRFSLADKPVNDAWAHPVLVGGRLYLRYHDKLLCYSVKAP
ncbi:MAG: PQQ-binding-like beta-propeller repeat protein [Sedimentisphaerales bacterium]|nr:PQQ-binding-like beta-propeller repeat protein [Sedimentisphaerales bacterium]